MFEFIIHRRYLEREVFVATAQRILFLTPDVTQWIKLGQGETGVGRSSHAYTTPACPPTVIEAELGIFLDPLNLDQKELIFLAVNDNAEPDEAGGSHW